MLLAAADENRTPTTCSSGQARPPLFITLGIYVIFWWYYVNREMPHCGRARDTELIVVAAVWTTVLQSGLNSAREAVGSVAEAERVAGWEHP
jgi:hypothetical protein